MARTKKIAKPIHPKPTTPTTRVNTCTNTQKAKEKTKQIEQGGQEKKRPRRKYVAQLDSEEEKMKLDDNNQFKVVGYNPLLDLENLFENVRNSIDLLGFSHVDFDKLGKVEKNQVEEALYAMMENSRQHH